MRSGAGLALALYTADLGSVPGTICGSPKPARSDSRVHSQKKALSATECASDKTRNSSAGSGC